MSSNTGYIYALIDPRDGIPRYIGQTTKTVKHRLRKHCESVVSRDTPKSRWIKELLDLSLYPEARALCMVSPDKLDDMEISCIKLAKEHGWPLTNVARGGNKPPYTEGENHPNALLTNSQVLSIRKTFDGEPNTVKRLARQYGVSKSAIRAILDGTNYPSVGGKLYNFDKRVDDSIVVELRQRYVNDGIPTPQLAEEYGINQGTICSLVNGNSRKDLGGPTHKRTMLGEDHPQAKLTDAEVVEIRKRYAAGGVTYRELAEDYGTVIPTIASIITGKSRLEAGGPISTWAMKGDKTPNSKLNEKDVLQIRDMYAGGGYTYAMIADNFAISKGWVAEIVRGEVWEHVGGLINGVDY